MSKSEYKKLRSKIINELRFNKPYYIQRNMVPGGDFTSPLELREMENVTKNIKVKPPNHSKIIKIISEMIEKREDEENRQFNNLIRIGGFMQAFEILNNSSYKRLDKTYRQLETDIKSNNYILEWYLTELEKRTNIKAGNLPEAFMLLKKAAWEKNKRIMIGILEDQPELLEQFKIATMHS